MKENKNGLAKRRRIKAGKMRIDCSFFFVSPRSSSKVRVVAQRLVSMHHVKEFHITGSEYGFIVKSALLDYEKQQELGRIIEKAAKGTSKSLISHCEVSG